jgi:hypothetical protein
MQVARYQDPETGHPITEVFRGSSQTLSTSKQAMFAYSVPDDGDSMDLRNASVLTQHNMTLQLRRPRLELLPPWNFRFFNV